MRTLIYSFLARVRTYEEFWKAKRGFTLHGLQNKINLYYRTQCMLIEYNGLLNPRRLENLFRARQRI